jgi:hypothetical protein
MAAERRWSQLIAGVVAFYLARELILYVALPAFVMLEARTPDRADT